MSMAVRIDPPDVQRARSLAIADAHAAWVDGQIAAGVDGVTPAGRLATSDYNQHVPDLEASGVALDMFALAVDDALAAATLA